MVPNRKLLVLHEKHGDRYFIADTNELVYKVALKIVKERLSDQSICPPDPLPYPPSSYRTACQKEEKEYERELLEYEQAVQAVQGKDGKACFTIMRARQGYEYESFDFEYYEEVE